MRGARITVAIALLSVMGCDDDPTKIESPVAPELRLEEIAAVPAGAILGIGQVNRRIVLLTGTDGLDVANAAHISTDSGLTWTTQDPGFPDLQQSAQSRLFSTESRLFLELEYDWGGGIIGTDASGTITNVQSPTAKTSLWASDDGARWAEVVGDIDQSDQVRAAIAFNGATHLFGSEARFDTRNRQIGRRLAIWVQGQEGAPFVRVDLGALARDQHDALINEVVAFDGRLFAFGDEQVRLDPEKWESFVLESHDGQKWSRSHELGDESSAAHVTPDELSVYTTHYEDRFRFEVATLTTGSTSWLTRDMTFPIGSGGPSVGPAHFVDSAAGRALTFDAGTACDCTDARLGRVVGERFEFSPVESSLCIDTSLRTRTHVSPPMLLGNILVAGVWCYDNLEPFLIARSDDGGATWVILDPVELGMKDRLLDVGPWPSNGFIAADNAVLIISNQGRSLDGEWQYGPIRVLRLAYE